MEAFAENKLMGGCYRDVTSENGLGSVGHSVPRVDGIAKATGSAMYVYDMALPNMLWGKILRSPHPHARIKSIDYSAALRIPGVRAVLTADNFKHRLYGAGLHDQPILAQAVVRFVGEAVAAVAADTPEIAERALKEIVVDYEPLPAVFDVEEAFSTNPPVVIHPDLPKYTHSPNMTPGLIPERPNVYKSHVIMSGDIDEGFAKADLVVENRYELARIQHCQMEPHCAIAIWDDDLLTVYASTNTLYPVKGKLCQALGLSWGKVRVIQLTVGGGFGGKQDLVAAGVAAGLSKVTGKPVKVAFTRAEVFYGAVTRHPAVIYLRDGVTRDGQLLARDILFIQNGGAYSNYGFLTTVTGCFGAVGSYRIPNFRIRSYGVYTNEPVAGAFRGFGNPQVQWAIETQMDIIAEKLGIDPVEFRLKNILKEGERNPAGEIVHSIGAAECLRKVAERVKAFEGKYKNSGDVVYGWGIALGNKYSLAPTASTVIVKIHEDGVVEARVGVDEVGQGMQTVMSQILAEEFKTDIGSVRVICGDTDICPYDEASISSRATYMAGNALRRAATEAKRQLFERASRVLEMDPGELEVAQGIVFSKVDPLKRVRISDLFTVNRLGWGRYVSELGEILGKATFYQATSPVDRKTGTGERLTSFYTHGAQAVLVSVDVRTGRVNIERVISAFDCGQPINPQLCEGQIEGGTGMGIGSALYEKMVFVDGKQLNAGFTDYLLPTTEDVPTGDKNEVYLIPALHRDGPYGAKGLGEGTMVATAPAIGNAIYNAIGVRCFNLPIEPHVLLEGLEAQRKGKHREEG
ncbi:Aldehyde oxidase/xanthine dehydrogenase, a/b hammerhead [Moorella glycerini]|uniref:4-hydroxybenzoyl-CoA reductase subunit alpha n=1 Tax=Neomoorella stamsii TaxID=1266720 RepID=A0A9X7J332_9FIRM|nr:MULTISPECIES: molybdopterin cofactor-binding domain-containing protein [Moorella]PRR73413.1 4-hydroxybenzoyl-CoA reductase subunit alpha [Moorella stamsii]CEP69182.1 Aldehyde oxidase/xanthine dehydrogenase, a/b hammerhead [Moorella glycerini]